MADLFAIDSVQSSAGVDVGGLQPDPRLAESYLSKTIHEFAKQTGSLESAVYCPIAAPSPYFLLVFRDESNRFLNDILDAHRMTPSEIHTICLRLSELYQLANPSSYTPDTLAAPYWLRNDGIVVYGRDIRQDIPLYQRPDRLLLLHLSRTLHRTRSHVILGALAESHFHRLHQSIAQEREQLMKTALLARGVWKVSGGGLKTEFLRWYGSSRMRENLAEVEFMSQETSCEAITCGKRSAYRAVWLFEVFLDELRRSVSK